MKGLVYYLERWCSTNIPYIIKNVITSAFIFGFACNAVKDGAFEVYGSTKSCLFTLLMCTIWSGIFNSIALFYSESEYVLDDLDKLISVRDYVIANFIIQVVLCIIQGIVSTTIFVLFFDFNFKGVLFHNPNFDFLITFILVAISADMLGFATGMLVKNITSAMALIPILLIAQFLFSGCLFELKGFIKPFAKYTTAQWGYSALGSISRLNDLMLKVSPELKIDSMFEATKNNLINDWKYLILLTIICLFVSGILLYKKVNYDENK